MSLTIPLAFIQELNESESLSETLSCITNWLPKMLPAHRASITFCSTDRKTLTVYAITGKQAIPASFSLDVASSFVGQVFNNARGDFINTQENQALTDCQMLADHGINTCLDVPLITAKHCYGTLNLGHEKADTYSQVHLQFLTNLATLLAPYLYVHHQLKIQEQLASTDELTGLANRRTFYRYAEQAMENWQKHQHSFFIYILDLDFFKQINDEFGHCSGDQTLSKFAKVLQAQIPETAHCARIGGEEFAILDIHDNTDKASMLAEKIGDSCRALLIKTAGETLKVTVSIGLAQISEDDKELDDIIKRADRALYQAKQQGRDQFQIN